MTLAWTTNPHGSWHSATTDTPAEHDDALALPGSWPWFRGAVLVRADQVPNLTPPTPEPPPVASSMTPNSGPEAGGTTSAYLTNGAGDATGILYGDTPGTLGAGNPMQRIVTSPPGTGLVNVVIVTPRGNSNPVQFQYTPPAEET